MCDQVMDVWGGAGVSFLSLVFTLSGFFGGHQRFGRVCGRRRLDGECAPPTPERTDLLTRLCRGNPDSLVEEEAASLVLPLLSER